METITSLQNPRVKQLVALQQNSRDRRRAGLFVVEGQREIEHCISAGYKIETLYYCPTLCPADHLPQAIKTAGDTTEQFRVIEVSAAVYEKIAYRGTTEGLLATVHPRMLTLDMLEQKLKDHNDKTDTPHAPLYIVLEAVEKPGNLGAILRSADAAGADAVIVCDPLTDLYNPNLIRSSIGAIFTVPTVACSSEDCIAWLKKCGVSILTAQLQDSSLYYDTDMQRPTAIVMGTEATGLTEKWRKEADAHIRIPMLGNLDSLNVSVSAAILLFEAVRQRQQG